VAAFLTFGAGAEFVAFAEILVYVGAVSMVGAVRRAAHAALARGI